MLIALILLVGLVIGSFLNVVILRTPKVMEWEWRTGAREVLDLPEDIKDVRPSSFNNGTSRCPHCFTSLRSFENIPLLSFIFLRGKCAHCKHSISWQYPLVEAGTALLFLMIFLNFGLTWSGVFLTVAMTCWWVLAWIDAQTCLLPDALVYLSLWIGLIGSALGLPHFLSPILAIQGAVVGWGLLWSVYWIFKLITKKEGMGAGDFKLLAALGVFVGPMGILPIVLISSLTGAVIGGILIWKGQRPAVLYLQKV